MDPKSDLQPSPWQPTLTGALVRLRPLLETDFEPLFAVASDPLLWEQHPERERYKREKFELFFRSGIDSKGALLVTDQKTGAIVGSSRWTGQDTAGSSVEIGYTFLARSCWGKGHNRELKLLMLAHAFRFVDTVCFFVGETNHRSRKAMTGVGATLVDGVTSRQLDGSIRTSVVFRITKTDWPRIAPRLIPVFEQPALTSPRLTLEPIVESHAQELWELFRDPELHHFVPFEPQSLEKQRERTARWSKRRSPDGGEIWLNWLARDKKSGQALGHFQAGIKPDAVAWIGYLVARSYQKQGLATEGLEALFAYLRDSLHVREARACADPRNEASHRLARKLGMVQIDFGSDDFVFRKMLRS